MSQHRTLTIVQIARTALGFQILPSEMFSCPVLQTQLVDVRDLHLTTCKNVSNLGYVFLLRNLTKLIVH